MPDGWVFKEQKMKYLITFQTNPFLPEIRILIVQDVN
jgi:hypothetical protein